MATITKSTAHAKGPWQAIKFPNLPWAVYETGPHELIVCQVSNPDWNRDEANAKLIAAAPDMLAELREAHAALLGAALELERAGKSTESAHYEAKAARVLQVIHKAEGR